MLLKGLEGRIRKLKQKDAENGKAKLDMGHLNEGGELLRTPPNCTLEEMMKVRHCMVKLQKEKSTLFESIIASTVYERRRRC